MVIEVSSFAKKKLNRLLEKEDAEKHFKFYIAGRNWSGPTFGLVLAEPEEDYFKMESEGYIFSMEENISKTYKKFTIDYIESKYRSGFVARGQKI